MARPGIGIMLQRIIHTWAVRPDWATFCTLGNHSKPVATNILPKLPTLLGNFCKCVKIIRFSITIIFGQLLLTFGDFLLVTLHLCNISCVKVTIGECKSPGLVVKGGDACSKGRWFEYPAL